MDLARRRIEQLQARGSLRKWLARRDLKTLDYLERHPDRKFPGDVPAWFMELGRIFYWGDPGYYRILRALVLDGKMADPERSRALRAAANFVGAVLTILQYLGLLGAQLWANLAQPGLGGAPPIRIDRLANTALFCSLGGALIAIFLFYQFQNDFRKLDEQIRSLD